MFEPTVQGDTRALQRGINRLGTARMGPVSIGPGDGHIRYYDASGRTTFRTDGAGAQVYAHGALRPLGGAIESKASQTYVDGNISTLVARDNDLQADINTRATRTYVDGNVSTIVGRLNGLDGEMATKAAITYVDTVNGRANAAQSRADSAYSRAGTGISDAAAAHARANAAYSLAASGPSSGDVSDAIATARAYTDSRIAALVAAIRDAGLPIIM